MRTLDRMRVAYWLWRGRAALKAGRVVKAEEMAEMIEEIAPGKPPAIEFRKRVQKESLAQARRLAMEHPEQAEAHGDHARALLHGKRFREAADEVRRGLRLLTAGAKGELLRYEMLQIAGEIAFERGRFRRSLDLFTRGEEPGFAMAGIHYYRGLCLRALGDAAACRREFTPLVQKAHWAVPMRHRELIEERSKPKN